MSLSLKQTAEDPWMGASVRWPANSKVSGIVTRIAEFGAFVELTPGVEGLIHISELSDEHVRSVADVVQEGQSVEVRILELDEVQKRISLSLKDESGFTTGSVVLQQHTPDKKRKRPLKGGLD